MAFFNQQPPSTGYGYGAPTSGAADNLQFFGAGAGGGGVGAGSMGGSMYGAPYGASSSSSSAGGAGVASGSMNAQRQVLLSEGRWWEAFGTCGFEGEPGLMEGEPHVRLMRPLPIRSG